MISDGADDAPIHLRGKTTGVRLVWQLTSEHSAIAGTGKKEKTVVAQYGF
jgi:hypothetical protein